ncbi:MAG: hypothetical protein AB9897_05845 [Anaerolineaceae bacterium]
MSTHKYTEQELRFTAILYSTRGDIVEYVQSKGKLPAKIPVGGFPTALNFFSRKRGFSPNLSEQEQLVFDAIIHEKRLPAGGAIFIPGGIAIYSLEPDQMIEVCPPPRTEDWE